MRQNIHSLCIDEKYEELRKSIIFEEPPKIKDPIAFKEISIRFKDLLSTLNTEQASGMIKCILADNYHMILGTPGSGKT